LVHVPNGRLTVDLALLDLLKQEDGTQTISAIRDALSQQTVVSGVDPEHFWVLGQELGYEVTITWSGSNAPGCYNVALLHPSARQDASRSLVVAQFLAGPTRLKRLNDYATTPLRGRFARRLEPQLRRFLEAELPSHMIPSNFVLLEALPLTPNGKVNRRALPDPDGRRPDLEVAYVPPQTELEQTIAKIWRDVLHVEQIGLNDNFFDMGGHSLLMAQIHSKLRETLGRDFSMIDLFKYPTISALTQHLNTDATPREPSFPPVDHERAASRKEAAQHQKELRQKHRAKSRNGA
jgi:acyl carrier protein